MKILRHCEDKDGFSVRVQDKDIKLWFDMWVEGGTLKGDWNAYIFDISNEKDLALRQYQEDLLNYLPVFNEVEQYLLERDLIRYEDGDIFTHTKKYEIDFFDKTNGELAETIGMRGLSKKEITGKVKSLLKQQGIYFTYTFKIRNIKLY